MKLSRQRSRNHNQGDVHILSLQGTVDTTLPSACFALLLFCFVFFFLDRVSWCCPGCPGIHYVDQACLNSTCPSLVLGLKA